MQRNKLLKEIDLKHKFKNVFRKTISFVEHGRGGTAGILDCILFLKNGHCAFIELKRSNDDVMRPSQKRFAYKALMNDQICLLANWEDIQNKNSKIMLRKLRLVSSNAAIPHIKTLSYSKFIIVEQEELSNGIDRLLAL